MKTRAERFHSLPFTGPCSVRVKPLGTTKKFVLRLIAASMLLAFLWGATGNNAVKGNASVFAATPPATAPIGQLSATPSSLNFGNVSVGGKSSLTVVVKNIGTAKVNLYRLSATGTGFRIAGYTQSFPLRAGGSTMYVIRFSPTLVGYATGSLTFETNALNSTLIVPLSGTGSQPVAIDKTAPTVSVTSPTNGAAVSGTIAVAAKASDNVRVASVQFQLDGANVGSLDVAAPYAYSWDTTKSSNGSHTLRAIAKDAAGNQGTSVAVTVTVNNNKTAPRVSVASPTNGTIVSGTITVSGTASGSVAISTVQVSVDGGSFSKASGTTSWSFSLDSVSLSNAAHTLTAKATDSSGNTATSNSVSITVNNSGGGGSTATINWTDVHQQIDGFGASSAWTGTNITTSQADLLFSASAGVGLSLLRTRVAPDGTYSEATTMQQAVARGARVWSTPWTPPASMKSNGSTTNGGSLLASDYPAYASYLSNYVRTLKSQYGINLYALSIQNEPDYTATWESCNWTGSEFHDFILNNLIPTFAADGVTAKVIMPEESGWHFELATATLDDPGAAAGISIIAGHNYDGASASSLPLAQNQGKHLWETEVSNFGAFDPSMSDALSWAQKIHDWMTVANANAWHYWWLIDGNSDNEGLISQSGQVSKRLYMMGNFSKFVRPGYDRIGATASPVSGVSISAYKNPSGGNFAIVVINHNGSDVPLNFSLNGFTAVSVTPWVTSTSLDLAQQASISVGGSTFSATLPASSVTTFVGIGN